MAEENESGIVNQGKVFISGQHMISALGFSIGDHVDSFNCGKSGISKENYSFDSYWVGKISDEKLHAERKFHKIPRAFSRLEALSAISILTLRGMVKENLSLQSIPVFLASTKGNIDAIPHHGAASKEHIHLSHSAQRLKSFLSLQHDVTVVCNACTSGLQAIILAARLIQANHITEAIVCGVDVLSEFTLRGFSCLQAMAKVPCQPFDEARNGISLGEGCATIYLSNNSSDAIAQIVGMGVSNDANHISGPSRTGSGLIQAIRSAVDLDSIHIDYINAHGTATKYNDEMEAQAFNALNLQHIPLNSMKGYWGHTLGAAGVLETIAATIAMQQETIWKSLGYENHGVSRPLAVTDTSVKRKISHCLKTSSGFGGSNACLMLKNCAS